MGKIDPTKEIIEGTKACPMHHVTVILADAFRRMLEVVLHSEVIAIQPYTTSRS